MKTLDRLIEKIAGNLLERRYAQNARILQEFPWMWAVRSSWELSTDLINVTDSMQFDLSSRIADDVKDHREIIIGLWAHGIRSINGRPLESVRKLWESQNSDTVPSDREITWNDLVHNHPKSETILHVAM